MASPPVHHRDRALRRLSLVSKGVAAGAVIATGGVTAAIAGATPASTAVPGVQQKTAVKPVPAPRKSAPASRATRPPVKVAPKPTAGTTTPAGGAAATSPKSAPPTSRGGVATTPPRTRTSAPKPPPAPPTTTEPPPPTSTYEPPVVPDPTSTGGS